MREAPEKDALFPEPQYSPYIQSLIDRLKEEESLDLAAIDWSAFEMADVKLTGKATADTTLTVSGVSGIDTAYAGTFTGVSKSAAGQLTVANNTDLGAAGLEVTFTFTMPASDATISIA